MGGGDDEEGVFGVGGAELFHFLLEGGIAGEVVTESDESDFSALGVEFGAAFGQL